MSNPEKNQHNAVRQSYSTDRSHVSWPKLTQTRVFRLHQRIIEYLKKDPVSTLEIAHNNLRRWRKQNGDWPAYMDWEKKLRLPVDEIINLLESNSDEAILAQSTSPFAGVIPARERWEIINSVHPEH